PYHLTVTRTVATAYMRSHTCSQGSGLAREYRQGTWCTKFSCMHRTLSLHAGAPQAARDDRSKQGRPPVRKRSPAAVRKPNRDEPLSAILASGALARLVTHFAIRPDEATHMRGLQRATGLAPRSLQTELARLQQLGVIQRKASGRQVRYR